MPDKDNTEMGIKRLRSRRSVGKAGATALAAGLGLAMGAPADAAIVYTDVDDVTIFDSNPFDDEPFVFPLDMNNDGTPDFYFGHYAYGYDEGSPYQWANLLGVGGSGYFTYGTNDTNGTANEIAVQAYGYSFALKMSAGELIDAGRMWYDYGFMLKVVGGGYSGYGVPLAIGSWLDDQNNYLGLRFDIPDGSTHYGWAQLYVEPDTAKATLFDYAYQSAPDTPIKAGQMVPVPDSLMLLASGAASVLAFRRKKRGSQDPSGSLGEKNEQ